MEETKIDKALKRLEGVEVRIVNRGGKIVKIPAQTIRTQEKDGVLVTYDIPADII